MFSLIRVLELEKWHPSRNIFDPPPLSPKVVKTPTNSHRRERCGLPKKSVSSLQRQRPLQPLPFAPSVQNPTATVQKAAAIKMAASPVASLKMLKPASQMDIQSPPKRRPLRHDLYCCPPVFDVSCWILSTCRDFRTVASAEIHIYQMHTLFLLIF